MSMKPAPTEDDPSKTSPAGEDIMAMLKEVV